jgi:predicted PurR-regulated permease PerM
MENNGLLRFLAILLTIIAIIFLLAAGQNLLVPLATAGLLAMVLNPLLNWLMARGLPKGLGILVCVLVFLSFFALVAVLLSVQIELIAADWPKLEQQALRQADDLQAFIERRFGVAPEQQMQALRGRLSSLGSSATGLVGELTLGVGKFILIIIYLILFLAERSRIEKLILSYNSSERREEARTLIDSAVELAGKYMIGQIKIIGILAVLYSIGFSIGGVPYAIFLAILAALFSLIPFIGNIIGGGIAAALALVASGTGAALIVIIVIIIVQMLSDYVLQPIIVGTSIDLSPLLTIFCIVAFSTLWGPMGAVLALPLTATLQTLFKQIPALKPLAGFMGTPKKTRVRNPLRRGEKSKLKEELTEEE